MNKEADGLSTVEHIEALADQLSICADELHKRIMQEIQQHCGQPPSATRQAALRALFDNEMILRQRANGLYADAAGLIVGSLGKSQRHVAELTAAAAEKIRKIAVLKDVTGLVAGMLSLAGAAATGQPAPIMLALSKIKEQLAALEAQQPKATA
ncbi:hypothetical protein [Massilia cavernae]|uniref:Uncharacterized protein n=1 Tax=Massilia cavernae TaxID=2320864 RepID=A0A418Y4A6_9BURK|nr:hypothetical protein [Massilia cavernae]RJG20471.1 hypothetical protein D3872_08370 [Massilia cavernae]